MAVLAVVSTVLTQTDKLAVSRLLPLEMLGYYTLATALATVPLTLASPIASAVYPRLAGLVASGDRKGLIRVYHRTCEIVALVVIPASLTVALFANNCISAWTGSAIIAQRAAPAASLLLGGQVMQALTLVPYYVALAHGNVRLNLQVGFASVLVITPLLIFLITRYGIIGAGLSWLIMNVCTLVPYMVLLHARFLPNELRRWVVHDVLRPLVASFPPILLARLFMPMPSSRVLTLGLIGLVWAVAASTAASTMPGWRSGFTETVGKRLGASYGA